MLNFNAQKHSAGQWNATFTPKTLLVESDPEIRQSRQLLFASLGLSVHAVGCYPEVFQLLGENRYQLIVLDLLHNREDASQIAQLGRVRWPEAKILLLGYSCGSLDDWLYDDLVDPRRSSSTLVESVQRLLK
jgi:hypothetical protein